ncbi:hypothetical protein AB1N83_014450 [Pleurotus pulmonarius]
MNPPALTDITSNMTTALYEASPPSISSIWRLHFVDHREASPHDLFALLRFIDQYLEIGVITVLRTWNDDLPIYWVRFENTMQALVARGFATNAEGQHSVKVTGALVSLELFRLAEEEEDNPQSTPPLATNRWDYPIQPQSAPSHDNSTKPPALPNTDTQQAPTRRPLQERIQHSSLLERIALD